MDNFTNGVPSNKTERFIKEELFLEVFEALTNIIEIGKRDMSNPKYDGYFETAREVIKKYRNI